LFALSVALWGFGVLAIPFIRDEKTALIAWRFTYAFSANWIPVLFYHFVCIFCDIKRRLLILTQYFIGVLFFAVSFTPLFTVPLKSHLPLRKVKSSISSLRRRLVLAADSLTFCPHWESTSTPGATSRSFYTP